MCYPSRFVPLLLMCRYYYNNNYYYVPLALDTTCRPLMHGHVHGDAALLCRSVWTKRTLVRLLTGVYSFVDNIVALFIR